MHKHLVLFFSLITVMLYFGHIQAAFYANKNHSNKDYKPQTTSTAFIAHYINTNTAAIETRESSMHYPHHNKLIFHNTSQKLTNRDSRIKHRSYTDKASSTYSPAKYTIVDYNNMDVAISKRPLDNSQQQHLESDLKERGRLSLLKQLESQKQELSKGYTKFIYDPYQLTITPNEKAVSSTDHYKTRYLASYVTPSPSHSEMHSNLHHNIPHINYNKATIVSHATGNEPSPMTTTSSIKTLSSIENMQHFLTTVDDGVKYSINNKLNNYDNSAEDVSEFYKLPIKTSSKQYLYAPMRPTLEKELPFSSNTLPYPPSFISITTTEKPLFNYNLVPTNIPDLFAHRQSKSLWDSYIPSWQISKMLQQFKNKPNFNTKHNLQTLAFTRQNKIEREK